MKIFIYLLILISITIDCESNNISYSDKTYRSTVHSVELFRDGWRLSAPYRNLRDTTTLALEFDDLTDQVETFTYTIIHCTPDWIPTDMQETEYMSGLSDNEIRNYRFSRNTLQPFIHYRLTFPGEDLKIKIAGNYILYVYRNYDRDDPVLTRRFYIVDPQIPVKMDVHRTDNLNYFYNSQEVDFSLDYSRIPTDNPTRDIRVTLLKNYNWNRAIQDLQPKFVHPGELIYDYEEGNIFAGGSEFRHFDTKSLKFNSDRIDAIVYERPLRHVYLKPDLPKDAKYYEYQEDLNGRYLIKWDDATDSDTEADYVVVHFLLRVAEPFEGKDVYVFGGLSDFNLLPEFKMTYDLQAGGYVCAAILKQGYYNYQYFIDDQADPADINNPIEHSFFETMNEYYLFVYFKDIRDRYFRLSGLEILSSVKVPVK